MIQDSSLLKAIMALLCYGELKKCFKPPINPLSFVVIVLTVIASKELPDPRRPKTKPFLNRIDLVKLGYASFLKNGQEDRSQTDQCAVKSWLLASHKAGIYPICIRQTNIKLKIQLLTSIAKHNANFNSFMF